MLVRVGMLAGLALLLLSPWIARVVRVLVVRGAWPGLEVDGEYLAVPYDLLLMPRNVPLSVVAVWGLTLGLWRRRRGVVLVGLWLVLLALAGASRSPTLPVSAVVISLFLPAAVLAGYFLSRLLVVQTALAWRLVVACAFTFTAIWGALGMSSLLNPNTVLLTRGDLAGIDWVRQHVPANARFLINSRRWQGNIYVGTDAGYWLSVLARRETVPPPALYVLGSPTQVERTNEISRATTAGRIDLEMLQRAGITHVFVGARGGPIDPSVLLADAAFELLYAGGDAWIFRVDARAKAGRRVEAVGP